MSTTLKPPIAANLRQLKADRGCTIREMAVALDAGERSVQMWLSDDEPNPSWDNVVALARYFGIRPAQLYELDDATAEELGVPYAP